MVRPAVFLFYSSYETNILHPLFDKRIYVACDVTVRLTNMRREHKSPTLCSVAPVMVLAEEPLQRVSQDDYDPSVVRVFLVILLPHFVSISYDFASTMTFEVLFQRGSSVFWYVQKCNFRHYTLFVVIKQFCIHRSHFSVPRSRFDR